MDLVKVEMVELQALQAGLDAFHDVIARQAARIDAFCATVAEHLGGDHDVFARYLQVFQRLTGDDFRAAVRIDVGRVDEVDAGLDGAGDELVSFGLPQITDLPVNPVFAPEGHRAEAKFRDE